MFIFLASLLGLFYGAVCMDEACLYKAEIVCGYSDLVPLPRPFREEKLHNTCKNLNQIKECIKDSVSNCTEKDVANIFEGDELRQDLKYAQKILNVTTEICREGSELHENFVQAIPCFEEVFYSDFMENFCRDYTNNAFNYIQSRVNEKFQGRDDERHSFYECLNVLFYLNCFLESFVKMCSSRVKDTVIKIIEIGVNLEDKCPVSIRIDILEMLNVLKLVTRKKLEIRRLLETDPFFS